MDVSDEDGLKYWWFVYDLYYKGLIFCLLIIFEYIYYVYLLNGDFIIIVE